MDICEMHVLFRTIAQQMGMQKVRAILPDNIDTFINQSIMHIIRAELQVSSSKSFKEDIASQKVKISPHNALTTLVCNKVVSVDFVSKILNLDELVSDILYLIDFSISKDNRRFVKCRWIENDRLEQTIDDYCSRDTDLNPIITIFSVKDINTNKYFRSGNVFTGGHNNEFNYLKINYLRTPAKVKFVSQTSPLNVNCDLPEYLHTTVVETAAELYMLSLGITSNKQDTSKQSN